MEFNTIEEIEARLSQIKEEMDKPEANLEELRAEVDAIETRKAELRQAEEQRKAEAAKIAEGAGVVVKDLKQEERKTMTLKELRNSREYIDAYAEFVKTKDDTQVRALLEQLDKEERTALMTENVTGGTIAVPELVYDEIKTAWDENEITSLLEKVEIAGNLKVNFEISGSAATFQTEGQAVDEETLTEGIATIVPQLVVKWKGVSKQALKMRGEAFLRYIYRELAHKITKAIADQIIAKVVALPTTATATSPAADQITSAPAMAVVSEAIGHLSDEASAPVVVMNKLTWSAFKAVQYANGYGVDPFEGLKVHFSDQLPAYATATAGAVYMIVGDFKQGALANFPDGEGIDFTFDELTKKTSGIVEVLGEEYVGTGVVANKAFTNVLKPTTI